MEQEQEQEQEERERERERAREEEGKEEEDPATPKEWNAGGDSMVFLGAPAVVIALCTHWEQRGSAR